MILVLRFDARYYVIYTQYVFLTVYVTTSTYFRQLIELEYEEIISIVYTTIKHLVSPPLYR